MLILLYVLLSIAALYIVNLIIDIKIMLKLRPLLKALDAYQVSVERYVSLIGGAPLTAKSSKKEKIAAIKAKFDFFQELTLKQLDLIGKLDQPSSNASHSRFKNSLRQDIKQIEEEKMSILQSILDDGVDAEVKVITPDGSTTKKRISEIVNMLAEGLGNSEMKTDSNSPKNNVTKLQLVKENDNEPGDPKIH